MYWQVRGTARNGSKVSQGFEPVTLPGGEVTPCRIACRLDSDPYPLDGGGYRNNVPLLWMRSPVKRLDLRGDNRLPMLLDERERLRAELSVTSARLKEVDDEVKEKLGDAQQMVTDGWMVYRTLYTRKAYTVPAVDMQRISAKRTRRSVDTKS